MVTLAFIILQVIRSYKSKYFRFVSCEGYEKKRINYLAKFFYINKNVIKIEKKEYHRSRGVTLAKGCARLRSF